MSQFFASGGQSIGASASASVLMNIQDEFPLGLTGLISLQSKELSRVFFNTEVEKHQILQCSAFFRGPAAAAKSLQSCPTLRPHRRQPTRLPRAWDSPGKNTGVGCHFLLQCMKVKSESEVAQSCRIPGDPMNCSLPGFSVHGIFQARVLEWAAIAFSINC